MLILSCQFVIPKTEKKEIKTEIKQEPGIHIKQEIDDRAHLMTGNVFKSFEQPMRTILLLSQMEKIGRDKRTVSYLIHI